MNAEVKALMEELLRRIEAQEEKHADCKARGYIWAVDEPPQIQLTTAELRAALEARSALDTLSLHAEKPKPAQDGGTLHKYSYWLETLNTKGEVDLDNDDLAEILEAAIKGFAPTDKPRVDEEWGDITLDEDERADG